MPTTTQSPPAKSGQYVDFDEYVDYHLDKVRVGVKTTDVLTAAAGIAALVLGYLLLFVVCDHWIVPGGFGQTARVSMLLGIVVVAVAWVVWKVVLPARRRVTELYAADMIEKAEPELAGNLRNLVDLRRAGRPAPEAIKGTMEKRAALHMTEIDVDTTVDRTRLMNVTYALLAVVVLSCGYVLFSPKKVSTSIWRALAPTTDVGVATRTEILEVLPGDTEVLARSRIDVQVDVSGEEPESVVLKYTTADRRFVDEPVELRADEEFPKRYHGTLVGENGRGILQNLDYRVEAGDATSPTFTVTVLQPPAATVQEVTVTPPAYTGLPQKTRQGGHVDAYEGSRVKWTAMTNQRVTRAVVQFSDDETFEKAAEEVRMVVAPDGRMLTATLDAWQRREVRDRPPYPKYYRVQVWNERGDNDPEPTAYRVNVKLDLPPEVLLVDPAEDLVGPLARPANGKVPLTVEARDDYGLKSIRLKVRKQNETIWHEPIADLDQRVYVPKAPFPFDLGKLGLQPGDVIEVTLQAKDNQEPHSQVSPPTTPLRIEIAKPADPEELARQAERDAERREQRVEERREQREAEGGEAADEPAEGGEGGEPREGEPGGEPGERQPGERGEGDPMAGGEPGGEPREGEPGEGREEGQPDGAPPKGGERPDGPREGEPMPDGGGAEGTEPREGGAGERDQPPADATPNDGTSDDEVTQDLIDSLLDDPEELDPPRDEPKAGEDAPQPGEPGEGDPNTGDPSGGAEGTDPSGDEPMPREGADPDGGNPPGEGTEPNGGTAGGEEKPAEGSDTRPPQGAGPDKNPRDTEETLDSEFNDPSQRDPDNPDPRPSDVERLLKDDPNEKKPPTKEEVERELDRLRKQQQGQPGGEKQPGDPETPEELEDRIEQLEKKREELNEQPPMGGEGETSPMERGDPMGGEPMAGGEGETRGGEPGDPNGGEPNGGSEPMGGRGEPGEAEPNGDPKPMGDGRGENGQPSETLDKPGAKPEELTKPGEGEGGQEETLEKIDDEIERLEKHRDDDPTAGEPKPGDPATREEIDERIEQLKKRRDDIEKGRPAGDERRPEGDPESLEKRPGEGEPMGDPRAGEPSAKEELDREIERLEKQREGDPRGEPKPGDPRGEELDDRIEELKRQRDDLEKGEPAGGEPMGEPKPGERPGEPTERPGEGGEPMGGKPGERGEPVPGEGGMPMPGEGGKPAPGEGGEPGAEPGGQPGQGNPTESGDPNAQGAPGDAPTGGGASREGEGSDPKAGDFDGNPADQRNVDNARKSTELVLDKLERQLDRGEVDQEMLDRLGWNEQDLRNYVDRMKQRFQTFDAEEARPETEARRRQFEEMLRGLDFRSKGEKRAARTDRRRDVEGFGGRNSKPPAEFRERAGSFSRSVRDLLERSSKK